MELREISSVFSSPSTSFFSLFVVFPLPTVVENVGVYHLCRVFVSLEFIEHFLVQHYLLCYNKFIIMISFSFTAVGKRLEVQLMWGSILFIKNDFVTLYKKGYGRFWFIVKGPVSVTLLFCLLLVYGNPFFQFLGMQSHASSAISVFIYGVSEYKELFLEYLFTFFVSLIAII